jgi:predicted N-acetyltransferase YhbS
MQIEYRTGNHLPLEEMVSVYRDCTLGGRRPVDDLQRMAAMLAQANLVVTAWDGARMVGISRSLTDGVYVTYLSDLAVRDSHQRLGIGKELVRRTQQEAPEAMIVLLAAPQAVDYYPHIGFTHHPHAWILKPGETV